MPDRAVVAVSDDRQWLVVRESKNTGAHWFEVLRRVNTEEHYGYLYHDWRRDTGQDAHEVLREFLEGQDATS